MDGAALVATLVFVLIGLAVGLAIGALILRAAIALFNKLAGTPSGVPAPTFGKAMLIVFVTAIANMVARFVMGLVTGMGTSAAGVDQSSAGVTAQLLLLPFSLLVMAGMLTAMLPTSFGKGLLVALCQMAIVIVIVVAIMFVMILVSLLLGAGR